MLAAYTVGDAIGTILLFFASIGFVGLALVLLIALFRNRNLQLWAKLLLVVVVVFLPPLGVLACLVVWFVMRSRSKDDAEVAEFRAWQAEHEAMTEVSL